MESNTNLKKRNILEPNWPIRIAFVIVTYGLILLNAFSDMMSKTYVSKLAVILVCIGIITFVYGFRPRSESRLVRSSWTICILGPHVGFFISISARLAGLYQLPLEQRYPSLITPDFIEPFLLMNIANILCYWLGIVVFRRLYPDRAIIPMTPEEREEEFSAHP